jgi:hypothetical protein
MDPTVSQESNAPEVLRGALREIKASESTMQAAEEVIARHLAVQQDVSDQKSE